MSDPDIPGDVDDGPSELEETGEFGTIRRCLFDDGVVPHSFYCRECGKLIVSGEENFEFDVDTGILRRGDEKGDFIESKCPCGSSLFRADPDEANLCGYHDHTAHKDD